MKKIASALVAVALMTGMLTACNGGSGGDCESAGTGSAVAMSMTDGRSGGSSGGRSGSGSRSGSGKSGKSSSSKGHSSGKSGGKKSKKHKIDFDCD